MKFTEENPRPCLWCEVDLKATAESEPEGFDTMGKYGPKLVALSRPIRIPSLKDGLAIQCRNCGLITPGAETADVAWKYWNDGGHK